MTTRIKIKTILYGLLIYLSIILIFGLLYFWTDGIQSNDSKKESADLFNSIYFSFITFATIGYGDYIPAFTFSKTFVFIETTLSVLYIPIFGGYLFYQFFKRPKDILFPDKIYLRHRNNNIYLSARLGNKGIPTVQNVATIEFCYIRRQTRWTKEKYVQESPLFEETWFVDILLNESNTRYREAVRFLFKNKDDCFIRVSFSANDSETGQPIYFYKDYVVNEIDYGEGYYHVVKYTGNKKTPPDWRNFNKIAVITPEHKNEIDDLLQ
jgi:Ion channel